MRPTSKRPEPQAGARPDASVAGRAAAGLSAFIFAALVAVVRFLIKEGESGEGLKVLRESGARLTEESRESLVAELLAAERFADAYGVWSQGRTSAATLEDGGFEGAGRPGGGDFGWRFARATQGVGLWLDTDSPREGARSLKVEYAGNSDPPTPAVSQLVVAEPGALPPHVRGTHERTCDGRPALRRSRFCGEALHLARVHRPAPRVHVRLAGFRA